jgi:alpha-L-rhamnosidase
MIMKTSLLTLFIAIVFFFSGYAAKVDLKVADLMCENLRNPLGIDKTIPRLSWKVKSNKNGTELKAWQVLVAGNPGLLEKDQADLWNSGRKESKESVLVPYAGKPLTAGLVYYWKVRIWDETGNVSPWSSVAEFSIGLLSGEDWQALYIGFPTDAGYNECPQLEKTFFLEDTKKQMLLYVNSLGYHEVYLNGIKVGDGVLNPAVSQFNKRSQVITYDVSALIRKGQNDLILWLGSGWYTQDLPGVVFNGPLVKAQLEKLSENRREIVLATDASWLGRKSAYTRHGNWHPHQFGGEIIDGSLLKNDLIVKNTEERIWTPVSVVTVPDHEVTPQMVELNRIEKSMKPISIQPMAEDTFLIDMGKNLTGWIEFHFPELKKSQGIVLEYSDHLDLNGKFVDQKQVDYYIASGQKPEIFRNKFNYHGFRYIRISNLQVAPSRDSVTAFLIHTGYEPASGFECSDQEMNSIHDMILYTLRCLSLGGYLVDCPTLERLGYGGDGNASTETAQTMFNLSPLYTNWLQAWADCIRDDGGMPHTAPNPYKAGGGPYWCGFIITASWKSWLHYGDGSILEKNYPVMKKWLGYVDHYSEEGLLKRWPDTDYRGWYLGDWASPDGVDQTAETSVDLVNNCFLAVCYDNMQKIAGVLGKTSDASQYELKKSRLRKRIHQLFFHPGKNIYATGTQIDLAYPLLAGVVPEELISGVTGNLVSETEINRSGHIACGLVGIPVLTEWAINNQATDLIFNMLKKKDYPGYLYMIENGATTTWEHWNGNRSRIHNCYNGIGVWFYQAIGGIRPAGDVPAYRKVLIQPQIPKGITRAKTFRETPYGTIVVNWKLTGNKMEIETEIPVGTTAEAAIPPGAGNYRINGKKLSLKEGQTAIRLKSGRYRINYSL